MLIKALEVAIIYYIIFYVNQSLGVWQFNRPIIVGPLVGLILGNLHTGIILGATFESVFLGVIAVGGTIPADALIGSTIGTAVAILTGASSSKALAIAVPVAALGAITIQITYAYMALFLPKMDKLAKEGNQRGVVRWHFIMSFLTPLLNTIAIFFAILLGVDAIKHFLAILPKFVSNGFTAAGEMLPAVGFAMLLNMLFKKKYFIYFFLGFALVVYLKLPNLAVAIFAIVVAMLIYDLEQKIINNHNNNHPGQGDRITVEDTKESEEEDFLS